MNILWKYLEDSNCIISGKGEYYDLFNIKSLQLLFLSEKFVYMDILSSSKLCSQKSTVNV